MKATELIIGDFCESFVDKEIVRIEWLTRDYPEVTYLNVDMPNGMILQHNYTQLTPIPLTAEILEKNGFDSKTFLSDEWEKEVYFREFPGCVLEPNDDGKYTFGTICYWNKQSPDGSPEDWGTEYDSRIKGLHYVHELQHALRLCGQSDLADNFKI